jgi:hypothetical protein
VSRYYQRLTEVADLPYDDADEVAKYTEIQALIAESRTLAQEFREEPGMAGEAATAALAWLAEYESDLTAQASALETVMTRHTLARQAMAKAAAEHQGLAGELMTPWESRFLAANGPYLVNGVEVTGPAYAARLRHERDVAREDAAEKILRTMNEAVRAQSNQIRDPLPVEASGQGSGDNGSGSGAGSGSQPGRTSGGRGHGSSDPYAGIDIPSTGSGSGTGTGGETGSGAGSGSTDPAPPVTVPHVPIHIDGPNGGTTYPPPSVTEPDDQRWSEHYQPIGAGSAAGAVGIVGGVLGLGAAAASRGLGAGLAGTTGLAFGAGPGSAGALGGTSLAGTGYGSGLGTSGYGTGLGSAAGRAPAGGLLGGQAGAAAAAGSNTGRGAAGGRGSAASGAGGAGTAGRKDKRRHRLVGYQVDRLEDDGPVVAVDSEAAAAGASDRLGPLPDVDAGDRW